MKSIIRYLLDHRRILLLIPHPSAVGTASEEIFFALLKAQRSGRRLLVLFPTQLPRPLGVRLQPVEFFDIESPPLVCSPAARRLVPLRFAISVYFGLVRVWSLATDGFRRDAAKDTGRGIPRGGQELLWNDNSNLRVFDIDSVNSLDWSSQYKRGVDCKVSESTELVGRRALRTWGVTEKDWWVCLHVRESGYYGDHESSRYRNADIRSYERAITEITKRGGWVMRLGDPSMAHLKSMDRVIDVAHDCQRTPRLDAFLIGNSRAFVGMQSGIMDTAILFGRPLLITNMYGWLIGLPYLPNARGVFQHMRESVTALPVSVVNTMQGRTEDLTSDWGLAGVMYETLNANEIHEAVTNFLDWVTVGCPQAVSPLAAERQQAFLRFLEENKLRDNVEFDVQTKYRLASRVTPQAFSFQEPSFCES